MKKIMFVMMRTLGDVICGTTIVKELKKKFPDSEIDFYTDAMYAGLLENNPNIRSIVSSESWVLDNLFMIVAKKGYDEVFMPYQVRGDCNVWHQNEETRHQHLVDFYWKRMGMHEIISERECYLYPSESDFKLAMDHISMDVPRIAIHSTTGVPTKDWPYFSELVEELRQAGYGCIQVGAKTDKAVDGAVDLRGKMGWLELAAFLSKCAAFVGLDSGVSYMADAMKTPCIIIQGSTNPVTSGPLSKRVIHLFAEKTGYDDCQTIRCHMNCRHEVNCITSIKVTDVIKKIKPILENFDKPIPVSV